MSCELFDLRELTVEHFQIREVLRCVLHTIMFTRALGLVRPKDVESELFEVTYVQCGDPTLERRIEEKIDQLCAWVEKCPTFYAPSPSSSSSSMLAAGTSPASSSSSTSSALASASSSFVPRAAMAAAAAAAASAAAASPTVSAATSVVGSSAPSALSLTKVQVCLSFYEKRQRSGGGWFGGPRCDRVYWEQWCLPLCVLPQPAKGQPTFVSAMESAERQRHRVALEASLREMLLTVLQLANERRDHIPPVLSNDVACFPYDITIPSLSDSFGMDILKRMLQATPPPMLS